MSVQKRLSHVGTEKTFTSEVNSTVNSLSEDKSTDTGTKKKKNKNKKK